MLFHVLTRSLHVHRIGKGAKKTSVKHVTDIVKERTESKFWHTAPHYGVICFVLDLCSESAMIVASKIAYGVFDIFLYVSGWYDTGFDLGNLALT